MRAMSADRDLEVELKLEATAADLDLLARSPLLADVTLAERQQLSTYLDAPGNPLHAAGLSLRVRQIGDRFIQTVKAESAATAGLYARPEWEQEIPDARPVLDETAGPLTTLLAPAILQSLSPAFAVTVARRVALLPHGGASIELVLDVGQIEAGDHTAPIAELELELKSGPPGALFSLARAMNAVVPLRLGVLAKSERGDRLADRGGRKSIKAEEADLTGGITTAQAFQRIAGGCLRQFRLNEVILLQTEGAEALHQARVALRRLRSSLSIFKPVLADARFDHLRGELRWLAGTLGEARDIDVLIGRRRTPDPARLEEARAAAYTTVRAALGSQRAGDLMIDLSEWIAIGAWLTEPADAALPNRPVGKFAADTLDKLRRRLKRAGRKLADLDDMERHEVRIIAKKMRYAAGFFTGLFPGKKPARRARRFGAALADLQEHLGDLNDLAHGDAVLARLGIEARVRTDDAPRRKALIAAAAQAHEDFADSKPFWR
jgi:triphosphatase